MTTIIASKTLQSLYGKSATDTLHTVTVGTTLAGSLVFQNQSDEDASVAVYVTGIAAATNNLYLLGKELDGRVGLRHDLMAIGAVVGNTSAGISDDCKQITTNGGLSWSLAVEGEFWGFAGATSWPSAVKLVYIDDDTVHLYAASGTTLSLHDPDGPFVCSVSGIGAELLVNPKAFLSGICVVNAALSCFWPVEGVVYRFYSTTIFSSTALDKTLILVGNAALAKFGLTLAINNSNAAYSGCIDLTKSVSNYFYFSTAADSSATVESVVTPSGTDGVGVSKVVQSHTTDYVLVIAENNKAYVVAATPNSGTPPVVGAASALPGGLTTGGIAYAFALYNSWCLVSTTGVMYTSLAINTALSWTVRTPTLPVAADSVVGAGQYVASALNGTSYFPAFGANVSAMSRQAPGFYKDGKLYEIESVLASTLLVEQHTVPARSSIELSGRIFPASAAVKVASRGRVNAALYGVES